MSEGGQRGERCEQYLYNYICIIYICILIREERGVIRREERGARNYKGCE